MKRLLPLLPLLIAAPATASPFAGAAPVEDATLAQLRGGVRMPDGMQVAVGIQIETRVDGQLVLMTQMSTENDAGVQAVTGDAAGTLRIERSAGSTVVVVNDPTLELRHLIGNATGAVVANTANDRVIETVTTIDIELRNALPVESNGLFNVHSIAIDAATRNRF